MADSFFVRSGLQRKGRLGGDGPGAESELLQLLLHGSVSLLSARKIAGDQAGTNLTEILEQGILIARVAVSAEMAVMVQLVCRAGCQRLEIRLEAGKIVLSSGEVAGLEIRSQLVEGLRGWADRCAAESAATSGGGLRKGSLKGGEIGLRGREIAGSEGLAELLDLLLIIGAGAAELARIVGAA